MDLYFWEEVRNNMADEEKVAEEAEVKDADVESEKPEEAPADEEKSEEAPAEAPEA